jgi:hypothetical protein
LKIHGFSRIHERTEFRGKTKLAPNLEREISRESQPRAAYPRQMSPEPQDCQNTWVSPLVYCWRCRVA